MKEGELRMADKRERKEGEEYVLICRREEKRE